MTPEMLTGLCMAKFATIHYELDALAALFPEAVANSMTSQARLNEIQDDLGDIHTSFNTLHGKARYIAEQAGVTPNAGGVRPAPVEPDAE